MMIACTSEDPARKLLRVAPRPHPPHACFRSPAQAQKGGALSFLSSLPQYQSTAPSEAAVPAIGGLLLCALCA